MKFVAFLRKYKKHIIALLLVFVLILVGKFISKVDFKELGNYLIQMPEMFVGVLVASFLAYTASTIAWKLILGEESKKLGFINLFMIKHIGEILTTFNPTGIIAGEGIKAVYLRKYDVDTRYSVSSIAMIRILLMVSGVFLMLISGVYLIVVKAGDSSKLLYIIITVVLTAVFSYFLMVYLLNPKLYLGKTVEYISKKKSWSFLTDKVISSAYEINKISSNFFMANKVRFIVAFLLCMLHWIFLAVEFYIIFNILGLNVSVIDSIAVQMGVILFITLGAVVPGQIGIEEYGNKVMFDAIGIQSNEVWFVATLMRRARLVFWLLVAGIFMFFISKTSNMKFKSPNSERKPD